MTSYWIVILGFAFVYGALSVFLPARLRRRTLSKRNSVPFDAIYESHFRDLPYPRDVIRVLWREAAEVLRLDEQKLRPTDSFSSELSCRLFPLVDLNEDLWDRFRDRLRRIPRKDWPSKVETLGQYVEISARLEAEAETAHR